MKSLFAGLLLLATPVRAAVTINQPATSIPLVDGAPITPATVTATGAITSASSMTASGFFGRGEGITGVTASVSANLTGPITSVGNATTIAGPVPNAAVDLSTVTTALALKMDKAGDTMSGQLTLSGSTLTVTGNALAVGVSTFVVSGGRVGIGTSNPTVVFEAIGDSCLRGGLSHVHVDNAAGTSVAYAGSSVTVTAATIQHIVGSAEIARTNATGLGILTASPATPLDVNGASQFGSGATKSTFSATGALTLDAGAALTVTGNTFSVGRTLGGSAPTSGYSVDVATGVRVVATGPSAAIFYGVQYGQTAGVGPGISLRSARGSEAAPTATQSGDIMGLFVARGYGDTVFSTGTKAGIFMLAGGNFTDSSQPTTMSLQTTTTGALGSVTRIHINNVGNTGIGTSVPATLLDVAGATQFGSGATKSTFTATGSLTLDAGASLTISSGTAIRNFLMGSGTVDCPSVSLATSGQCSITATGVNAGDNCGIQADALETNLTISISSASLEVVAFRLNNPTVGNIDPASQVYRWWCFRP